MSSECCFKEMKKWQTSTGDIRRDAAVFEAIFRLTQTSRVRSVAMTEEILGCPHEEGVDYPLDEVCPECPFWAHRKRPLDLDSVEEAIIYADLYGTCWNKTPGAIDWLKSRDR